MKPPHRLDVGTEGVVVLCKDTVHANAFRLLLSQKDSGCLQKHYRWGKSLSPDSLLFPVQDVHTSLEATPMFGRPQLQGC